MSDKEKKIIEIPEITRVEGHSAVTVEIENGEVTDVKLDVFEGTRFFEQIVLDHKYDELPHITSRVCAICSTGHVLAAIFAVESACAFVPSALEMKFRELMHLGMIIESHATHVCALALPDFLKVKDLLTFAVEQKEAFLIWTNLRNLGARVQTLVGGRPFHPVNLHVGGLSSIPHRENLLSLKTELQAMLATAIKLADLVLSFEPPIKRFSQPIFLCLKQESGQYGYFGDVIVSSDGWQAPVYEYKSYLDEQVVSYSHAKRSLQKGNPIMVGSLARLFHYGQNLKGEAGNIYRGSPLADGAHNTILNNAAQAIEIVQAIERATELIDEIIEEFAASNSQGPKFGYQTGNSKKGTGTVECPRGTLYHYYEMDETGTITKADMITPSAQNTARIELDIRQVVTGQNEGGDISGHLETLVRAYDPCNTCATHMVSINWKNKE